jgi:sugar lactone lactonase YvrE
MTLDNEGIVWMLDNGRRSEMTPKVVAWNYEKRRLHSIYHIGEPAVVPGSFLADLAVDPNYPFLYITDPANGANAALIVMDRATGLARRVLQGHRSVVPDESVPLTTGRSGTASKRLDGSQTLPHNGADPIVLDKKGEWLYFAAIRSAHVYRVRTEHLRDPALDPAKLAEHVETWAGKPAATSFTLDARGNLYLGDVEGRAVGVIENDKKRVYRVLVSDPRLVWPDALCFGPDEKLYFFSRLSTGGVAKSPVNQPASMEHNLFRIQPLTGGRLGD